ncbi:dipeptidyl aminopeptidase/acylaminoacyl peptidase [Brevundimonas vesicularis]|uniref:S9 family peptidase n=1 Tax=Brevundimonas vesicularis TaxID=41276 RepID=UPI00278635A8|nr:prolyl oligopeptidase family serine peptidase [Brevundimonas vesicularis]MDQ1193791.1 dipeptidyl aminopeptidase/acylaminoacyl peptidase [Brevundimonas vesicularis]
MRTFIAKTARLLALALVLLCGGQAVAHDRTRPYTLDDLLNQAAFGAVSIDPSERWIVYEQSRPYAASPRFDYALYVRAAATTLWIADAKSNAPPRRLLPVSEGEGHVLGDWSPSGKKLLVFRLQDDRWSLGVFDLETRAIRWLDVDPDGGGFGRVVQWRSDDEIVLFDRRTSDLPFVMGWDAGAMAMTQERWRRQATGSASSGTVMGSGRFRDETPISPDIDLVSLDLVSGRKTVLSTGRFVDLELSPDRSHVAAMTQGEMPPIDQTRPLFPVDKPEARHVQIVDLDTGDVVNPCGDCALAPNLMGWSPDSRRVLVWRTGATGPTSGELAALGVNGETETYDRFGLEPDVGANPVASFTAVRALWQGDRPVLRARAPGQARYDWFRLERARAVNLTHGLKAAPARIDVAEGEALVGVAEGAVWRIGPQGRIQRLSEGGDLRPYAPFDILDAPRIRYNEPAAAGPYPATDSHGRVVSAGARWRPAPPAADEALITPVALSRNLAAEEVEINGVRSLRMRGRALAERTLATLNDHLADVRFSRPVPVAHTGPDGRALTSWLYLPTRPVQGKIPLVVLAYPGQASPPQRDPAEFMTELNFQQLTAAGYAVLTPSLPRPFYPAEPAAGMADQLLAVVDVALEAHPELDGDRLVYWGQSFGGYSGLVVATQTTRFRSVIVQAVVSNLAQKWGEFAPWNRADPRWGISMRHDAGWAETSQGAMGGPPWSDPARYTRNSPLFQADRIQTPILVMQGERDMGLGQAESLFTALWRQNKDVRFVTWWGEGHTVESAANLREMYRQIFAWLEETVGEPDLVTASPGAPSSVAASSRPRPSS